MPMGVYGAEVADRVRAGRHWRGQPVRMVLGRGDVHVWRVPLDVPAEVVARWLPLLCGDEQARAERILDEDTGRRYVTSHGALRAILGRYLDERPERICFRVDARGKPHLVLPAGAPSLCFSLSHSGELALCAVTDGRDVGVDIERIRAVSACREIAARYFSPNEQLAFRALSGDGALEAFFHGWARKEAYSKALGDGVSQRWTQFSVSLAPGVVSELTDARPVAGQGGRFAVCPLEPGPGYVAAIAAPGADWSLRCWHWSWAAESVARIA